MSPSLVKREEALSAEYLPPILPFRESQIKQVASNLEPVGSGRKGHNTFIFGSPGIGKTVTAKFVLRQLESTYPGVRTVYINCWDFNTSIAVLSRIATELGIFVPRRGLGKDEVNEKFIEAVSKSSGLVVCLDEVDQLVHRDPGALYSLLRTRQYVDKDITLVMISNNQHVFSKLESRVVSSLSTDDIEFKPYSITEMKSILSDRAKLAFSSFDTAAVMLASSQAVGRGGDVRVGLECLRRAGSIAAKDGAKRLDASHVKKVVVEVANPKAEIVRDRLGDGERVILDILKMKSPLSVTELYNLYSGKVEKPVSIRMFQDYLNNIVNAKMARFSERKVDGKRLVYRSDSLSKI